MIAFRVVMATVLFAVGMVFFAQPSQASTCGALQDDPIVSRVYQAGFNDHVVRARVYYRRCIDTHSNVYFQPESVRGGYTIDNNGTGCNSGRLDGYRFNFGSIGGYNPAEFTVPCDGTNSNSKTVDLNSGAVYTNKCWSAHETQVWSFANDIEKDVSGCMD